MTNPITSTLDAVRWLENLQNTMISSEFPNTIATITTDVMMLNTISSSSEQVLIVHGDCKGYCFMEE